MFCGLIGTTIHCIAEHVERLDTDIPLIWDPDLSIAKHRDSFDAFWSCPDFGFTKTNEGITEHRDVLCPAKPI